MIERVIGGFQDGADLAGIRAAVRFGIRTSGWMPRGFRTESGPHPEYAELYGAREHRSPLYPPRTEANVKAADWSLIFIQGVCGPGTKLTLNTCRRLNKPMLVVLRSDPTAPGPAQIRYRLLSGKEPHRVINVAGSRETDPPSVGDWVYGFMVEVFRQMGFEELETASAPGPRPPPPPEEP